MLTLKTKRMLGVVITDLSFEDEQGKALTLNEALEQIDVGFIVPAKESRAVLATLGQFAVSAAETIKAYENQS